MDHISGSANHLLRNHGKIVMANSVSAFLHFFLGALGNDYEFCWRLVGIAIIQITKDNIGSSKIASSKISFMTLFLYFCLPDY